MINITTEFFLWREYVRHLWNGFFLQLGHFSFDAVEAFEGISNGLLQATFASLDLDFHVNNQKKGAISNCFVRSSDQMLHSHVSVLVERPSEDKNRYWDERVEMVQSKENVYFALIGLFDWDVRSRRNFHYLRVYIDRWDSRPELVGREALLECQYCSIFYEKEKEKGSEGSGE